MGVDHLLIDVIGDGVAVITLNRPEKLNPLGWNEFAGLRAAMAELDSDQAVRACVLTGAGRAFSAGGDMEAFDEMPDTDASLSYGRAGMGALEAIERATTPVLAAVNGLAYGGGLELALACDIIFASDRATFAFKEISVGLIPPYGLLRAPAVCGRHWTARMALTGDAIDASRAEAVGLVQQVVPHDELMEVSVDLARRIAKQPLFAVRAGKSILNRELGSAGVAEVSATSALLASSAEHRQLVSDFRQR
jgi:enoyl-CoA hydratase/carnithine racemase